MAIKKTTLLLILIILFGAALRLYYMLVPGETVTRLSPDEAVYGLEAIHIMKGERPVFFYAQPYTGATSAYISALLFKIFGISDIALKIVPFVFSLLIIFLEFKLAEAIFKNSKMALVAAGLTALGSPFWLNWSSRAGTGYIEMMVFGALVFLLTIRIVFRRDAACRVSTVFFLLGLVAGFGFWVQPTIAYYLLPAGFFIFGQTPMSIGVKNEKRIPKEDTPLVAPMSSERNHKVAPAKLVYITFVKDLRIFFKKEFYLAVLGAVIGAAPVIFYNFANQSQTATSLFNKPWGIKPAIYKFFVEGMPVILGTRPPWSTIDFFTPLAILVWVIYLAGFLFLLKRRFKDLVHFKFKSIDLILAFFPALLFIFGLSSPFNQFVIEPRYIQAIYTGLPIVVTYLIFKLEKKRRLAGAIVLTTLVVSSLLGIYQTKPTYFVDGYTFDEVIPYLKEHGTTHVFADAALAHRLGFFAEEEIIAAPMEGGMTSARLPYYEQAVKDAPCGKKGIVVLKESLVRQPLVNEISGCEIPYEEKIFDGAILVVVPK